MKNKYFILIPVLLFLISSCKKNNNDYIAPVIKGSRVIAMGANYENAVYFKLSTEGLTSVPVDTWDLAFESTGGNAIRVNIARKAGVYVTTATDFAAVTTVPVTKIAYDDPNGDLTKTAIGDWSNSGVSKNLVYVIYRGNIPPNSAIPVGYKKFQIKNYSKDKYTIQYANLDGTDVQTKEIAVNTGKNFTYFSFDKGTVSVEPDKNQWDILFTGITVPGGGRNSYVVSPAVLSNRYNNIQVGVDNPGAAFTTSDDPAADINTFASSNSRFSTLTKTQAEALTFSNDAMTIGRGWHQILMPHGNGIYKIYDWKTYVVKDHEGKYFKIKFTAFKNLTTGEVGYPSFEYEEIQ